MNRPTFSLAELLAVITIAAVLCRTYLLFLAIQEAREAARRSECANGYRGPACYLIPLPQNVTFVDEHLEFRQKMCARYAPESVDDSP